MQQNVMITICSRQEFVGQEPDSAEFVTEGTLSTTEDGFLLEYDESELTGMEGTHTAFHIHPETVSLVRSGAFRSEMVFERNRKHFTPYETPYGTMTLDIVTHELTSTITENGGELNLCYAIEIQHQLTGVNRFQIRVRRTDEA